MSKPMNILYLHTHDSGRYFQPYGHAVPTPNLMRLAEQSTLFRNAHCAGPTCSPSRAALLTGMSPHSCGMLGLAHRGFAMADYSRHLSAYLSGQGYHTALSGIQHEAPDVSMLGYQSLIGDDDFHMDRIDLDGESLDRGNAAAVADFLRGYRGEVPLFLSFGMFNTHRNYPDHRGKVNPDYVMPAFVLADTPENRDDMAAHIYSASIVDDCVGVVLEALEQSGLAENTLVLFTTDHGIAMPFMKCSLYDTGTGVALMLRYPGNPTAGRVTDALVSQVDVFPTLCQLCGLEPPEWLEGVSLVPVLNHGTAQVRRELFSEVSYHAAYEPMRCVRTQTHKLIRRYDYHLGCVPANIDASPAKDMLLENGLLERRTSRELLFDLRLDPLERVNLIDDAGYAAVYDDLSQRLFRWMRDTDDPLLRYEHRIPRPPEAIVNPLEQSDPQCGIFEE
ncbi:sulfatase [Ruminococcaceae bacterium OttesenSCG-928-L11]|nr:sulfatase [Ruminococcaceae bacterium OttesenSCG-928-L11]